MDKSIELLNEANSKSIIKSNCRWDEVYAIYNTLPPHERLFLGSHFIDSPNTVFRWIEMRNGENAGFIELYDMKPVGSHKGELIVSVAICTFYRRIGVLEELQKAAEKFVSEHSKYNKLIWLSKDANIRSVKCAKRLGYTKKYHESDHWVYEMKITKNSVNDISNDIEAFNKELNSANYGILVNGKIYTGDKINFSKYRTISPKDFEKYYTGTCWDYVEYEAKQFEEVFEFNHTLKELDEKQYSMYYMQIDDSKKCPTHTWLAYKLNGKVYLFESSWFKYQGIKEYKSEEDMIKDYIKKHKAQYSNKPIIVTKYNRNTEFGLTPKQFMKRCIDNGKVIYSEMKV